MCLPHIVAAQPRRAIGKGKGAGARKVETRIGARASFRVGIRRKTRRSISRATIRDAPSGKARPSTSSGLTKSLGRTSTSRGSPGPMPPTAWPISPFTPLKGKSEWYTPSSRSAATARWGSAPKLTGQTFLLGTASRDRTGAFGSAERRRTYLFPRTAQEAEGERCRIS